MLIFVATILFIAVCCWWFNRRWLLAERRRAEQERELERFDHAQAHEKAKAEAELMRWTGPY